MDDQAEHSEGVCLLLADDLKREFGFSDDARTARKSMISETDGF